ncbi:RNA helicase [Ranunculus cassubicifolius]
MSTTAMKPVFRSKSQREQLQIQSPKRHCSSKSNSPIHKQQQQQQITSEIESHYIGITNPKRRVIKRINHRLFDFDWDNTEDTSRDTNSLYQNPHEANPLFGTGFRGGVDRIEQKKLKIKDDNYDVHWSEKKLGEMKERDWRIFKEDFDISYKGIRVPKPMRNWEESELSVELLKAVKRVGYVRPSPIQMAAIPLGLQQRDVIGVAQTGSGKTAAYILPMLDYISRLAPMNVENEANGPYALVLAPTRELVLQIEKETVKFAHYLGIKVVSIIGGHSKLEQGLLIQQGCEVVIATPGRLYDCLESKYAVLNQCNFVVLDEADQMIKKDFEEQVVKVLDAMPSSNLKPQNGDEELDEKKIYRTTYMFSATMPPPVERLARKYLRNPVVVTVGTAGKTTDLITQDVIMTKESDKMWRLRRLLDNLGTKTAIVFVNHKKSTDSLSRSLDKMGYRVTALHGGNTQDQRETSLDGFRSKRFNVLVATDIAGRGIDIPDVAHVINYDMTENIEAYTHRIGRTGRAGKTGVATTFLTLDDTKVFYDLKQFLIQSNSVVPPDLARNEASKFRPGTIYERPYRG